MADFRGLPGLHRGELRGDLNVSTGVRDPYAHDTAGEEIEMTLLFKDQENLTPQVVK